ncbi:MAG: hypothetical protein GQF41_4499 [Candidatus Rifleibacterium amylolyticum]|nr:MAG: hypothetical protein GQF41_4499 [Candidatus Rifleibacterium amylolyticum]
MKYFLEKLFEHYAESNEMPGLIYSIKKRLLTIFGDIKIFKWPMFVIYHPTTFRIKGHHTREIMNILQPGDVVMRSYRDYLDGYFIPKGQSKCSHSGVYIGDNRIVHSIAEGSVIDDIIDYCRADRILVLRPASGQEWAIKHAKACADHNTEYDFNFEPGQGRYYCHEFTASCYPKLEIRPLSRKIFAVFSSPVVYLADSFYTNKNFELIYCSN